MHIDISVAYCYTKKVEGFLLNFTNNIGVNTDDSCHKQNIMLLELSSEFIILLVQYSSSNIFTE